MNFYIDVILPLPLEKHFTYEVNRQEGEFLKPGMRVAVPFGKTKMYTGIVSAVHTNPPQLYEAKPIEQILDEEPVITAFQLQFWSWIANYYMCAEGEVMRAALPGALLLESETLIQLSPTREIDETELNDQEYLIYEALITQSSLRIQEVVQLLDKKTVLPVINRLVSKNIIVVNQEIFEQYKPKLVRYVKLAENYSSEVKMPLLLEELNNAPKQRDAVLTWFQLTATSKKPVPLKDLSRISGASTSIIKSLIDKNIFEEFYVEHDRVNYNGDPTNTNYKLNKGQEDALKEIISGFAEDEVCLLQ